MNWLQKLARQVIKTSFYASVWVLERRYDTTPYQLKLDKLALLPDGSLGKDIYNCLITNHLRFVPRYESHDLKHVLLNFKMTPEDEIRMQAFMLGNGNFTFPCLAILLYGVLLLPDRWGLLWSDFKRGRKCYPIASWTVDQFADKNTLELKKWILTS